MPDPAPYVPASPGDLITAENWNAMQIDVQQDIAGKIKAALTTVTDVPHATNADQIGGMNLAALEQYIRDQIAAQLIQRSGYMQVLCNLRIGQIKEIKHEMKAYPVVDLYQLEYFLAVCAKGGAAADESAQYVLFYLYNAEERRLRIPPHPEAIEIEETPPFRVSWKHLIDQFREQKLLDYTDQTTLDDLENDFWKGLFSSPNDTFDPDAYCHSPWFEKCCGERRTVKQLTDAGDFDDIYLQMRPKKTVNVSVLTEVNTLPTLVEPANVLVSQLDYDAVGLTLFAEGKYPVFSTTLSSGTDTMPVITPTNYQNRLPVLALLKV